ncbi:MAG: GNAT family N-acetyltransferase [Chloroflexota bacterium]
MALADPPLRIRRIRPDEGPLLRELRLRSLADSPDAFGQHVEDAELQPAAEWTATAKAAAGGDRRAWFIAEVPRPDGDARAVGLVLGRRRPPDVLLIFSMWVDPAVRRLGVGSRLIATAEAWASTWGARESVLWVFGANDPAIRFYHRLGFTTDRDTDDARTGAQYGALAMRRRIR